MELTITKEKVLAAAENCSSAKETLKVLFPEAFEKETQYIHEFNVNGVTEIGIFIGRSYAPSDLCNRCVMVDKRKWQVYSENDNYITLVKKDK